MSIKSIKTKGVSDYVSGGYKLALIKEEIAKCEVVCACCHRIRTWKREGNKSISTITINDPYKWVLDEINANPTKMFQAEDFRNRARETSELVQSRINCPLSSRSNY